MAAPETARFGKFRVLLGDDSSPIEYAAPCGFTSKSLSLGKSLSEVSLPDCDDPDKPIVIGRDVESITASVSGNGVLAAASVATWLDAYESTESVPVKVEVEFSAQTIVWTGKMHIASLELGAEQGGRVTLSVEMQSDGELARVTDASGAPTNTLLPSISGVAQQGVVLTANNGAWSGWPTSYTYQWQEDDGGWTNITGATGKTYTPAAGNVGNALRVIVTAINSAGSQSATSAATADVLVA